MIPAQCSFSSHLLLPAGRYSTTTKTSLSLAQLAQSCLVNTLTNLKIHKNTMKRYFSPSSLLFPFIVLYKPGTGLSQKIGLELLQSNILCNIAPPNALGLLYKLFDSWRLIAEVVVNRRQDVILWGQASITH